MKKDIDKLIADERAEIILKYDKVCNMTLQNDMFWHTG